MKLLIDNDAALTMFDKEYGCLPLEIAAMLGHETIVKLLIDKLAELKTVDKEYGRILRAIAANCRHKAIVKLLNDESASLNMKRIFGPRSGLAARKRSSRSGEAAA